MRLSLLMSIVFSLGLSAANSYSQTTKISLDLENITIKELLKEIGKNSEFSFWYSNDVLNENQKISLSIKNLTIDKVLDLAFKDKDLRYDIKDKVILIYKSVPRDAFYTIQNLKITGKVIDGTTNEPLPGVNILVVGSNIGTVTDVDGKYQLEVPNDSGTIMFSYVGYLTEKVSIIGKSVIDVKLFPDLVTLQEVVVTALGISCEKKTLTYSTRQIGGTELSNSREINLTSALQGKVAGVNINNTNSGPGGSTRLVLRGDKSIKGNNQPLIVLDGVPIDNTADANAETTYGVRDNGDGLSNINSDDIESLTVLPGPAAAALYGSSAGNGAIIINTRKGTGNKKGIGVQLSSSVLWSNPMIYPKFQNEYGQGTGGIFLSNSESSWGPKMTGQMVTDWTGKSQALTPQPDNFKDFFRTGSELMNTLAITSGHTYFSYTNTSSKGIIPNNKFRRNNFNIRETFDLVKGLTLDTKLTYMLEDDINRQSTGQRNYAVCSMYQIPRSMRLSDVENFESIINNERVQNYWNPGSLTLQNPYWSVNRNLYERMRKRFLGMLSLKYQLTQALSVQVRGSIDSYNDYSEEKDYNDSYWVQTPGNGNYILEKESNRFLTGDALITYTKDIITDLNLNLNAGASIEKTDYETSIANNMGLVVPNVFTTDNAVGLATYIYNPEPKKSKTERQSVYGAAQLGFKKYLFLNVTARNDWSSTLPANNLSYFYPSVGANLIVSEMLHLPEVISFLKIRGTYAMVGNDTKFDNYRSRYEFRAGGNSIFMRGDGTRYNENLKPEITHSWEGGFELNMWQNKLGLDVSVYHTTTDNQILTVEVPSPSGYLNKVINAGEIENKGIEITLNGKPLTIKSFSWDIGVTFSKNINKVRSLDEGITGIDLVTDHIANITAIVGERFSDLWVRDFRRNAAGQIVVDNNGIPLPADDIAYYAGNPNPNWRAGISNTFRYKNLSLSALIDIRQGGVIISNTDALLASMGCSERTLANRDAAFVVPNSVLQDGTANTHAITAESYWKAVADAPIGTPFIYDASNIRLREVSLTYTLPKKITEKGFIKEASISLLGRNLFFFKNKTEGIDPESAAVGTGSAQGIDYCPNPSTRSYGFQLRLNF